MKKLLRPCPFKVGENLTGVSVRFVYDVDDADNMLTMQKCWQHFV